MDTPEVWLRGPLPDVPPLLQPVAHSLLQSREEIESIVGPLTPGQVWHRPGGTASIGYHARHAAGSLDRLFTYARGALLSPAQLAVLRQEATPDPALDAADLVAGFDAAVERALDQLRSTEVGTLSDLRAVGRGRLPSTVGGLLFHAAEHAQRHAGQIATIAKLLAASGAHDRSVRRRSGRPEPGEYAEYIQPDIDAVPGDDAIEALMRLGEETPLLFRSLADAAERGSTYDEGKWTLKELLGHLVDDERIFAYRLLAVARGEPDSLAGFDEKLYAAHGGFERRSLEDLLDEYAVVRASTVALLRGLPDEAWSRRGVVNGYGCSVRGLAFHIAAHEMHHQQIVRDRYIPAVSDGTPRAVRSSRHD